LYSHSGNYKFSGSIDQVKIYNYARTPAQVAYDYNRGGPVGWWKMDECQGIAIGDWSGNNNTGTLNIGASGTQNSVGTCQTSGTAWGNGATGKWNSSLNFDGTDDYINIGRSSPIGQISPTLSVSAWINVKGGENTWRSIVEPLTGSYFHLHLQNSNKAEIYFYGPAKSALSSTLFNSTNYNKWYHLVGVWDGTYAKIYINGTLEGTSTAGSGNVGAANSNINIGQGVSSTRQFNGLIDDVRIYNYALTQEQIKQLYNGGSVTFN